MPLLTTLGGADLYAGHCASCHGMLGHGDGRSAASLRTRVPDLSRIAVREGEFDYWRVHRKVSGLDREAGSEMPQWSQVLAWTYANRAQEELVLHRLVGHLETLQRTGVPMSSPAPRIVLEPIPYVSRIHGETMYDAYCAQCHGELGRGDGRIASRLGVPVPDLTLIAASRGGFDRESVRDAIAARHMVPTVEAEPWSDVLIATYGFGRGQLMLNELARHVEAMQADR